jgi:hypothetical protein
VYQRYSVFASRQLMTWCRSATVAEMKRARHDCAIRPSFEPEREARKLLLLGTAEGVPVPILLYAMAAVALVSKEASRCRRLLGLQSRRCSAGAGRATSGSGSWG